VHARAAEAATVSETMTVAAMVSTYLLAFFTGGFLQSFKGCLGSKGLEKAPVRCGGGREN
jgi:hypothetical protein